MREFSELLETLKNEMKQYEKLYSLLEKDSESVTTLDRNALGISNSKKEVLLQRLARMNEKREFLVSQISKKYFDGKLVTLKKLTELVPEKFKDSYQKCQEEFYGLVRKVRERNLYNKEYINLSLKRLRAVTNNLNKYMSTDSTYNYRGKIPETGKRSFLAKEA